MVKHALINCNIAHIPLFTKTEYIDMCLKIQSGVLLYRPAIMMSRDDVIKGKNFPCYWPFVRGMHRSPVNSPNKGQWRELWCLFDLCLKKGLSKQSGGWWFETPSRPLLRHYNMSIAGAIGALFIYSRAIAISGLTLLYISLKLRTYQIPYRTIVYFFSSLLWLH